MNYEVVYQSQSAKQNTKKIAEVIASVLNVTPKQASADLKIPECNILFVGSGCYIGHAGGKMLEFLDNLPQMEGKKAAVFGTYNKGKEAIEQMKSKLEEKGFKIVGTWGCMGAWLLFSRGHPDEKELQGAREFAEEMMKKAVQTEVLEKAEPDEEAETTAS